MVGRLGAALPGTAGKPGQAAPSAVEHRQAWVAGESPKRQVPTSFDDPGSGPVLIMAAIRTPRGSGVTSKDSEWSQRRAIALQIVTGRNSHCRKGLEPSRRLSETTGPQSPCVFRIAFLMAEVTERDAACKQRGQISHTAHRRPRRRRCGARRRRGPSPASSRRPRQVRGPVHGEAGSGNVRGERSEPPGKRQRAATRPEPSSTHRQHGRASAPPQPSCPSPIPSWSRSA